MPALWQVGVQGVNFQTVDGNLNQMIASPGAGHLYQRIGRPWPQTLVMPNANSVYAVRVQAHAAAILTLSA